MYAENVAIDEAIIPILIPTNLTAIVTDGGIKKTTPPLTPFNSPTFNSRIIYSPCF